MPPGVVLVPIRSFDDPKTRLADVLTAPQRDALARHLAGGVLTALAGWDVVVVTDDHEVARWAERHDARAIAPGVAGLNAAVTVATALEADRAAERVAVVHADLARPDALGRVLHDAWAEPLDVVTLVPDRANDGTNVLVVPTLTGFEFRYGPGSFDAHRTECSDRDLRARVHADPGLALDVDTATDLADVAGLSALLDQDGAAGLGGTRSADRRNDRQSG